MNIFDILNDGLLNFHNLSLIDNLLMEFLDWDDLRHMNFLDHYLDDLFRNSDDSLLDNWNLNSTIYNLFNLDNLFHNNVFNHFNVLDLDDWHQFLSNHFDLFDYCFN